MHPTLPRRTLALSGSRDWSQRVVAGWLAALPPEEILWIGDRLPEGLALPLLSRRQQLLGDEYSVVVIDAWAGFDPEQFGAASGTLRGGGALILLLPADAEWLTYPDPAKERIAHWPHTAATLHNHFIARSLRLLRVSSAVEWFDAATAPPASLTLNTARPATAPSRSNDQQRAIAALHHLMSARRHRPLVLLADRGRGKSAALGMAARELIAQGVQRIIVTAPHRNAVHSLFAHAAPFAPEGAPTGVPVGGGSCALRVSAPSSDALRFIPPDELLRHPQPCELLLVDEAAAIPAPLLEQLLHHYPRIAFATTVHGYEGTGRGFALRFFKVLDRLAPGWQKLELSEPIRWCDNDPLERLASELLLLDAEPASDTAVRARALPACRYAQSDAATLAGDDPLLQQLFGLLVLAHYRTSPLDLRLLLDSPDVTLHLLRHDNIVVAAAITLREGGFDKELAHAIYMGQRRPRGHLAAQALAFYCGEEQAPQLLGERIMRIAVHPALQQQGLGSTLLDHIASWATQQRCDYLSASFGATPELLRFWRRNGLLPVRIGMAREASSGYHSALVVAPLSPAAQRLFCRARQRFQAYLPLQLREALRNLDALLVPELLREPTPAADAALDVNEWRDLFSFANGRRGYASCIGAIHKLVTATLATPLVLANLSAREQELIIAKVVRQQSWREVSLRYGMRGEADALEQLRTTIKLLVAALAPDAFTPGAAP